MLIILVLLLVALLGWIGNNLGRVVDNTANIAIELRHTSATLEALAAVLRSQTPMVEDGVDGLVRDTEEIRDRVR